MRIDFKDKKLTHWCDKKFVKQTIEGKGKWRALNNNLKPCGFWLSVNNSWENWFRSEWESWNNDKECLFVELDDNINLFIIDSKETFLKEFKKFIKKDYLELDISEKWDLSKFHSYLKDKYDGMMLLEKPFLEHRLDIDFHYFYGWDCESICVWNKNKIRFKKIGSGK